MMLRCSDETLANKFNADKHELFDMYACKITCCALAFIVRLRFPPGI